MTSEFDANRAQNLPEIEKQMAVKCVEHAQTYWNLLEKLDARSLRLTKLDDDIYAHMLDAFPELAEGAAGDAAVGKIDEEEMKSESGKTRWREFIARYEGKGEQRSERRPRSERSERRGRRVVNVALRCKFHACAHWELRSMKGLAGPETTGAARAVAKPIGLGCSVALRAVEAVSVSVCPLRAAATFQAAASQTTDTRRRAVTDYNFGTLIRTDASEEYTQFNTTFGESRWR
jgi:hypothetical protein